MNLEKIVKESFVVIGKEGSTDSGEGFIARLWEDANAHFSEVQHLAQKNANGEIVGIWGVMSDFSRSFAPWEDFSRGLYLAGVECGSDAEAPDGWTKWVVPGYEYLRAACQDENTFAAGLQALEAQGLSLAGAVHDFTCPQTGTSYMLFPIRAL